MTKKCRKCGRRITPGHQCALRIQKFSLYYKPTIRPATTILHLEKVNRAYPEEKVIPKQRRHKSFHGTNAKISNERKSYADVDLWTPCAQLTKEIRNSLQVLKKYWMYIANRKKKCTQERKRRKN